MNNNQVDPLGSGVLFLLGAAVFAVSLGFGIALPVLPLYLERLLADSDGFSVPWHTGMLTGVYMFALFAFAPVWGHLSDRVGRRPVILAGLGGFAVALVMFGLAWSLWLGYLARGLSGAFAAAVLPVASAYVADTNTSERRARRFAGMGAASLLGFLSGPATGGWLASMAMPMASLGGGGTTSLPFFVAAAVSAGILWIGYLQLPEAAVPVPSCSALYAKSHVPEGGSSINLMLVLTFLAMFGLGSFEVAVALQGQQTLRLGPSEIGIMFMECSLVMLGVQALIFSGLVKRFSGRYHFTLAFLLMATGLWLLPGTTDFGVLLIVVGLIAGSSGLLLPLLSYEVSLDAGLAQGSALGKQTAAASLGQGVGSAAAGVLFGVASQAPFWVSAALLMAGAVIGFWGRAHFAHRGQAVVTSKQRRP